MNGILLEDQNQSPQIYAEYYMQRSVSSFKRQSKRIFALGFPETPLREFKSFNASAGT